MATQPGAHAGVGSVLLLPEMLAKPMRDEGAEELTALAGLLSRLDLRVVDAVTAEVATSLAATHRCTRPTRSTSPLPSLPERTVHHYQPARFPDTLTDIDITYPDTLPDL